MKTPWTDLLQYGVGIATIIVLLGAGLLLLTTVGLAVLYAKIQAFIH